MASSPLLMKLSLLCSHERFVELLPSTYGKSHSSPLEDEETRQPIELMTVFTAGPEDLADGCRIENDDMSTRVEGAT